MYQGASALSMDAKGRMSIPARHRDALSLQSEGRVTLTKHPHGCLLLFPRPVWEQHREQIANWPMSARAWQRIFLGSACDVDMDSAGRILISPELRTAVVLSRVLRKSITALSTHARCHPQSSWWRTRTHQPRSWTAACSASRSTSG